MTVEDDDFEDARVFIEHRLKKTPLSFVWEHYVISKTRPYAKCLHCHKLKRFDIESYSTSEFKKHLARLHNIVDINPPRKSRLPKFE